MLALGGAKLSSARVVHTWLRSCAKLGRNCGSFTGYAYTKLPASCRQPCGREKRSRPISRVLSRTIIHLGCTSPYTSSNLPGSSAGHTLRHHFAVVRLPPYLVLLRVGFAVPLRVTTNAVRSYRTLSPLPATLARDLGGLLSVALSVGSRLPGVTWHSAQWSPDFPPLPSCEVCSDCLADSRRAWCRDVS